MTKCIEKNDLVCKNCDRFKKICKGIITFFKGESYPLDISYTDKDIDILVLEYIRDYDGLDRASLYNATLQIVAHIRSYNVSSRRVHESINRLFYKEFIGHAIYNGRIFLTEDGNKLLTNPRGI